MASESGTNQSIERAAAVLSALVDGGLSRVSDIARHIDLGQSTTSRLLATLEALGYVEREARSNLYHLGPSLITLAGGALNQNLVHRQARQAAQNLAAELGLGVNVAIRRGASLFYLCNFEGRLAPKSFTLAGQSNPLHATGIGKCLLLGLSAEQRRELLPELPGFTPHTVTSHEELDSIIDEVGRRGYATEREELALGRACVAAPLLGSDGSTVAALSISGPLSAVDVPNSDEDELARKVIEVADSISVGLGYLGPSIPKQHERQVTRL